MIDIREDHLKIVLDILNKYVPSCEVRVFGSRYKWTAKDYSDLDIAIVGKEILNWKLIADIKEAFQESELPYRVDVLDWHSISPEFRKVIETSGFEVLKKKKTDYLKSEKLSNLLDIVGGGTPKTTEKEYWDGDIPWISVTDFRGDRKKVSTTEKKITKKGLNNSSTKLLKAGDLIISARGTVGELAMLDRNMTFNQSCYGLVAKPPMTNNFLYYLLKHNLNLVKRNTHGSVFDTITRETFEQIKVQYPNEYSVCNNIANILSSLDDKIELNNQMNQTLENMAKTIFKEWFIDFGPVKAKAESRKPFGMDDETAALFPDSFEESELGLIPKGWRVGVFDELFLVNPKYNLKKNEYCSYVEMRDLKSFSPSIQGSIKREFKGGSKFSLGDTLLARISPCLENGKIGYVDFMNSGETGWGSTEFIVVRSKGNIPYFTSYLYLINDVFRKYLIQNMQGTSGRQRVPDDAMKLFQIAIPNNEKIWIKFGNLCANFFEQLKINFNENNSLTLLRDSLLPKLLSGEIEIKDLN